MCMPAFLKKEEPPKEEEEEEEEEFPVFPIVFYPSVFKTTNKRLKVRRFSISIVFPFQPKKRFYLPD